MGHSGLVTATAGGHVFGHRGYGVPLTKKEKRAQIRRRVGTVFFWLFIATMFALLGYLLNQIFGIFAPITRATDAGALVFNSFSQSII
jgi:hypothetical protein